MNAQSQKIIADLEAAGFDMSSLRNQMLADPIKDRKADGTFDGLLRQSEFSRMASETARVKQEYENKMKGLASAHDSVNHLPVGSAAHTAMKTIIDDYEKDLIEAGFSEESVKALSVEKLGKLDEALKSIQVEEPNTNINNRGNEMPNKDTKDYVDTNMLRTVAGQTAMGSILIGMQVNALEKELASYGINPTPQQVQQLAKTLESHLVHPEKNAETAFDEVFKLSEIRITKAKEADDNRLKSEYERGRADQMKEDGIPARQRTKLIKHAILDSKTIGQNAIKTKSDSMLDEHGNVDPAKLPRNADGVIERFKIRGPNSEIRQERKAARLASAANLMDKIQEHNANDPTYIG